MILKNLSRKSNVGQLVKYLFKEDMDNKPKPLLKHNMRARSIKGWTREFENNESLRINKRKDNTLVNHVVISLSAKDNKLITDKILKDIAQKFVELRGRENLYLITRHIDKSHQHIHCMVSGTKYLTGQSSRLTKKEFQELKINLQEYQKQHHHELSNSIVAHKRFEKSRSVTSKTIDARHSNKQQVYQDVEKIYSKSKSLDNFYKSLEEKGYTTYQRGGSIYGVEHEGRNFRFKTMGLSANRLESLDKQKSKEEKSLRELRELRNSKEYDRNSEENKPVNHKSLDESKHQQIEHHR